MIAGSLAGSDTTFGTPEHVQRTHCRGHGGIGDRLGGSAHALADYEEIFGLPTMQEIAVGIGLRTPDLA